MSDRISNEELAHLISSGESVSFEYKETLNEGIKERLSAYFAAFANTEGGILVLGISNSKETIGYTLKQGEREYISQEAQNCHPPVYIDIEEKDYDNNKIILIYVSKSTMIHTDKNHKFPVRVGSNRVYLDIIGLIPLAKERLGLTYGTGKPELPPANIQEKKVTPEDIELCMNTIKGDTKEVILEGLRDLELFLIWDNKVSDEPRVIDVFETLLKHPEVEVRKKALGVLDRMIRLVKNDESRQKLAMYSAYVLSIVKSDSDDEARTKSIQVLLGGIGDERVIEPIIDIMLKGSDEMYNMMSKMIESFPWSLKGEIKRQLKSEILMEIGRSNHPDNIKKRLKEFLEKVRWK